MRWRFVFAVCLLIGVFASASPEKREPDFVRIEANTVESPYFKFHYPFPQGWLKLDDTVRWSKIERNIRKQALA
jgi:hypothetical protein